MRESNHFTISPLNKKTNSTGRLKSPLLRLLSLSSMGYQLKVRLHSNPPTCGSPPTPSTTAKPKVSLFIMSIMGVITVVLNYSNLSCHEKFYSWQLKLRNTGLNVLCFIIVCFLNGFDYLRLMIQSWFYFQRLKKKCSIHSQKPVLIRKKNN